ncbi:hypothetical protein EJB05_40310 [Eragrostis curvula]|uniref:N-acetyltransferase domain-containing protein n=1 Tax=Eragrostis curvula TaxID=38414 RepID=A0A5J9TZC5_9POAL|nr:hypothetical protein EJB05_40310 [Eragrostis curvula]
MKMTTHAVSVEMAVNYFAVTIAHQHIIKLVCLRRSFQKVVGTATTALARFVEDQLVKRRSQHSRLSSNVYNAEMHTMTLALSKRSYLLRVKDLIHGFVGDTIFIGLNSHVGIDNIVGNDLSWSILRCNNDGQKLHSVRRISRLTDCNTKLAVALTLLEECFIRMVDPRTGVDMIPHVVYSKGSKFARLDYQGFYTIILEKGDEIVCVASIRIHGTKAAELPFIATSIDYRRQGMCRRLMDIIEKMLRSYHVKMLVLSAIPELVSTWISGFGFKPIEDNERKQLHNVNLMLFPGTSLLTKRLDGIMTTKPGEEKNANDVCGLPIGKTSKHLELHDLDLSGTEFKADISVSDPFRTLKHECSPGAWFQSSKLAVGEDRWGPFCCKASPVDGGTNLNRDHDSLELNPLWR